MSWVWHQRLGELYNAAGERIATGYSGHGEGVNNPALQSVHDIGPIPQGLYKINAPRDTESHGPYVLPLTPYPTTETFGRDGFMLHGDSITQAGKYLASKGCPIAPLAARQTVWNSGDHDFEVIA